MGYHNNKHNNFAKNILLALFFVIYLIIFWFLFFTKGIYVDGHFYKKSANLTTVTYTCRNPFADYKKIVMQKQMNTTIIAVDDAYVLTVNSAGGVSIEGDMGLTQTLPDARWDLIATQEAETSRGIVLKQSYITVFILYALFFLAKHYNTRIYEFFRRSKAPGENYYRIFDKAFTVITIAVLIYFILPV